MAVRELRVDAALAGQRLDQALAALTPELGLRGRRRLIARRAVLVSGRAMPAYDLAQAASEYHNSVTVADSVQEAVEIAFLLAGKDKETVIIAFGSLSYLGELITVVEHRVTIRRDSHGRSEEN